MFGFWYKCKPCLKFTGCLLIHQLSTVLECFLDIFLTEKYSSFAYSVSDPVIRDFFIIPVSNTHHELGFVAYVSTT